MGLFDFLGNVGAKILGDAEANDIKNLLDKGLTDKISNLKVDFDDGTAELTGDCDCNATKEKAILLAGNIQGVTAVNADRLTIPADEEADQSEFYTVKKDDSLSKIAKVYYGNAMKYPEIFEANREVIKDPDLIYPGQQLRIPKLAD